MQRHGDGLRLVGSYAAVPDVDLSSPGPDVLVLDLYLGRDDLLVLEHIPALVDWAGVVVLHGGGEAGPRYGARSPSASMA